MGEFCTSCGAALNEGAKFCTGCGAAVLADLLGSKAPEKIQSKIAKEAKDLTGKIFSEASSAYGTAGEIVLPQELTPFPAMAEEEGLFSVLKEGISGLFRGFRGALGDKKRLVVVIALVIIWLLVNLLASLGIFPLPVRFLSWLTAAQGSLIGGTIGKGLVAALLAQLIADQAMLQTVKKGLGQLGGIAKGLRGATGPLLIGLGLALIASNMMISSHLQNTMVSLAAFLLSAKALTQQGFLRKFIKALLPKAKNTTLTTLMRGWTLGFALFIIVSLLPGDLNGYFVGILLLIAGGVIRFVKKSEKGAIS